MYDYYIFAYKTRRYHWIRCEDMQMLTKICANRFEYDIIRYSTGKVKYEPNWALISIRNSK